MRAMVSSVSATAPSSRKPTTVAVTTGWAAPQSDRAATRAANNLAILSRPWESAPGVLRLPSGRFVRGRGLSRPLRDGPFPEFGLYLLSDMPPPVARDARWVRWPDFRLPVDRRDAPDALREAWRRAEGERWRSPVAVDGEDRDRAGLHRRVRRCVAAPGSGLRPRALRPASGRDAWQRRYVRRFSAP